MKDRQQLIDLLAWGDLSQAPIPLLPLTELDTALMEQEGVAALVQNQLLQLHDESNQDILSVSLYQRIKNHVRHQSAAQLQMAAELSEVLTELKDFNPILLKGAAMSMIYYPEPYLRPMADVDLLINPSQAEAVKSVLIDHGFELWNSNFDEWVMPQFSCVKSFSGNLKLHLDIHVRLFNRTLMHDLLMQVELEHQKREIQIESTWVSAPSPCHMLIHAVLHLVGHHNDHRRLIWLYDIHLILQSFSDSDRKQVLDIASEKGISGVLRQVVQEVNQCFKSDDVGLCEQLQKSAEAERTHPIGNYLEDSTKSAQDLRDFLHIKGFKPRMAWLKHHFFPNLSYIQKKYNCPNKFVAVWFYLWRILSGSVRLIFHKR